MKSKRTTEPEPEHATELHAILARGRFSPITRRHYARVIDEFLEFAGSDPNSWTRLNAQAYYERLLKRMTIRSANTTFASLRYVSRWYAKLHAKPELDFAVVQTQLSDPEESVPRHALKPDDAIALLSTCIDGKTPIDRRDRTILIVGLETGMRAKSLSGIEIEKYHEAHGYPSIVAPIKGPGGTKTWDVPLSDVAMIALRDWLLWLAQQRMTSGRVFKRISRVHALDGAKRVEDWRVQNSGISEASIWAVVSKRGEEAGLKVFPHLLRHSFITWRSEQGFDAPAISAITGHSIPGWGAVATYLDRSGIEFVSRIRTATPPWLAEFVRDRIR